MSSAGDIWVVAETDGERLQDVTREVLCDAREQADTIGGLVTGIVFGPLGTDIVSELGHYGADRVLLAAGSSEHARSTERCAGVLAQALERDTPRLVLFGATTRGREIASRVAAVRHVGLANDCNWVRLNAAGGIEAARIVYGGKVYARVRLTSRPALATLRPGAGGVGRPAPRQPRVDQLPPLASVPARVEHVAFIPADPHTVHITEAERIVAVGRGVGAREHLELYQQLADRLGAALAASRPLVDAGWLSFDRQVGQTGHIVAPRLYIAAGISGASQHTLGMKSSQCVVAINRDKNTEIFKLADLKVLADLITLLPALLRELDTRHTA
ncbi:MAG: electron transfer flavoprotein subunit alpha/FixB family protein [Candidatus Binatia bacterium]